MLLGSGALYRKESSLYSLKGLSCFESETSIPTALGFFPIYEQCTIFPHMA